MKLAVTLGAAALALFATAAIADDYVGGAIKSTEIGGKEVLVGANDMTLYTFDKDAVGVTNCYDKCAENWPPLIADAGAKPEGDFTLVDRTDGSKMWAYKGWPLYFWVKDEKPGDTTGDMVGEVWHTAVEK
jgi:predicted lipoprotein with Yx(FWY)xxD motif